MPAMFSWFPGTRAHRFLYVHEGWIKVKAEHRGARGSHLLPTRPGQFVLMFIRGVAELCRTSFKIQVRIQKLFKKKRERKKNKKHYSKGRPCSFTGKPRPYRSRGAEQKAVWILQHWDELKGGRELVQKQSHSSPFLLCLSFFSKHRFVFIH